MSTMVDNSDVEEGARAAQRRGRAGLKRWRLVVYCLAAAPGAAAAIAVFLAAQHPIGVVVVAAGWAMVAAWSMMTPINDTLARRFPLWAPVLIRHEAWQAAGLDWMRAERDKRQDLRNHTKDDAKAQLRGDLVSALQCEISATERSKIRQLMLTGIDRQIVSTIAEGGTRDQQLKRLPDYVCADDLDRVLEHLADILDTSTEDDIRQRLCKPSFAHLWS